MNENIIKEKIEKALDIICPLYNANLIIQAFIVGSVAKGTARKDSDIDIIIVNPMLHNAADLPPTITLPYSPSKEEEMIELLRSQIVDILISIGVEFREIYRKESQLWHQFYNGEIFHIMTRKDIKYLINDFKDYIEITRDLCPNQL